MIRVLSANLRADRARPEALRSMIVERGIDIVCAQELGDGLARTLAEVLPEGRLAPDPERRGLGIACRRAAAVKSIPLGVRDALIARLLPSDWPGLRRPIEILNVHFFAPHAWPYFPRRARRSQQSAHLVDHLRRDPATPRALIGDFNATPVWPLYRQIAALCRDGVADLRPHPPKTWPNLRRFGLPGLLRIDHCFVSGVALTRSEVLPLSGSDHYGLCVDLVELDV